MRHLFNSVVRVETLELRDRDGRAVMDWGTYDAPGADWVECRLDLQFLRPGRDVVAPINAGVVPDRFGIMFCDSTAPLIAGCRIVTIPNAYGEEPVSGTFEIKTIPEVALDFASAHHIEVQIIESVQSIDTGDQFGEEGEEGW